MANNIFAAAAVAAPAKKTKKDDKQSVSVPELADAIARFNSCKEEIDNLEAQLKEAEFELHERGRKEFLSLYQKQHKNPDSFFLSASGSLRVLYVPTDKYKTIDTDRKRMLDAKYEGQGVENITTEQVEYTFNPDLLERYSEVLSELISSCDQIDDDDKAALISAKVKVSVAKGAIDRLLESPEPAEMLIDIAPVIQLKRA